MHADCVCVPRVGKKGKKTQEQRLFSRDVCEPLIQPSFPSHSTSRRWEPFPAIATTPDAPGEQEKKVGPSVPDARISSRHVTRPTRRFFKKIIISSFIYRVSNARAVYRFVSPASFRQPKVVKAQETERI